MSQTSRKTDNAATAGAEPQVPDKTRTVAAPSMIEQSLLLWRVRRELARLQRIGDWQAYQDMLAVVAPVLNEHEGTPKAHEANA